MLTFSYKQVSHHKQYPSGTTIVFSYFESRGGKFPEVCFFGLQYLIKVGAVCFHFRFYEQTIQCFVDYKLKLNGLLWKRSYKEVR